MNKDSNQNSYNDKWNWVTSKESSYLQCKPLLEEGFIHGFYSKISNQYHPKGLINSINPKLKICLIEQVHGKKIVYASKCLSSNITRADGIISNSKNQSLWIYTADCIPLLFADREKRCVAAVHSGWRGLAKGIIFEALSKLKSNGSNIKNILVALGPAITGKNYEFNSQVVDLIENPINNNYSNFEGRASEVNKLIEICKNKPKDKIHFDIRNAAIKQLISSGLDKSQIQQCPLCTFSEVNLFHSWRRDKVKARQWSFISS